jgi:transposase
MMPLSPATRIFLASGATDLRKSFEGLGDLVTHQFKEDPLSGNLFVFTNRRSAAPAVLKMTATGGRWRKYRSDGCRTLFTPEQLAPNDRN